ncbi:transporter, CPA2 family [Actinacidiphila yanglinensis]|uniref:Transporter, CPA2 family n=1 Tax=Actinacidiphila yanglinensis TaxID=310779 RepID=A0A1H6E9T9_9ACTN|nr:cation:proton antiporter [Actinacidiphila yanglinensis]SEG93595.1 transporter, CPA2 family [Actinacidiphila yanglinensis]
MTSTGPVPPIAAHSLLVFLLQCGLLLLLAHALSRLATRCGLPSVVGELGVGVLLGPTVLRHVDPALSGWLLPRSAEQFHLLDAVGEFGVLLLVATTGMELDLGLVRRRGRAALGISLIGLAVPLGLGILVGWHLPASFVGTGPGHRHVFALFLGVALCVSAIPVIAKTLSDMNLLHRNVGQLTMAAGIIDDVVGWVLLSFVSSVAAGGMRASSVGHALMWLAVVVGAAGTVGQLAVRAALDWAERAGGGGATVAVAAGTVLLCAAATQAMSLEPVLGALVAGIMLRWGRTDGLARIAPLRTVTMGVLAPLFFATAGLRVDLTELVHPQVLCVALIVLTVAVLGKFAGAFLGARFGRLNRWEALAVGAGMNARGVVEVVVASVGLRLGILTTSSYTIVVLVAVVTSVMAPPILRFATRAIEHTAEEGLRARVAALARGEQTDVL